MDKVRIWEEETFPEIIEQAKFSNAVIYFEDETSIRQNVMVGKTWGLKGKTPIVYRSGKRVGKTIAGAISTNGRFYYRKYDGGMNSSRYKEYLKGLIEFEKKNIILIYDALPAHKSKMVQEFLEGYKDKIRCFQLPGYSPHLNPTEFIWAMLKKELGQKAQKSIKLLLKNGLKLLLRVKKNKALIKSLILNIYRKLSILS